jgi:elongation factor 1-alpha
MPWFSGWTAEPAGGSKDAAAVQGTTLVQAIDQLRLPPAPVDKPLRFVVSDAYAVPGVGVVVAGRVDAGAVAPGMTLTFAPGGVLAEVVSIERHKRPLARALPGASVGLCVTGAAARDFRRGMVAGDAAAAAAAAPRAAVSFVGQVLLLAGEALRPGYTPTIDCGLAHGPVKFRQLLARIDRKTGATLEEAPGTVKAGDTVLVDLVPQHPLVAEPFADSPMLGRFALRDQKRVIGIGMVKSVVFLDLPAPKKAAGRE